VPGLSAVNPDLADILQGYKNALDAALMATRLITGVQSSNARQPASSQQRTDGLEVRLQHTFSVFGLAVCQLCRMKQVSFLPVPVCVSAMQNN